MNQITTHVLKLLTTTILVVGNDMVIT